MRLIAIRHLLSAAAAVVLTGGPAVAADPVLPTFDAVAFARPVPNPYFPLVPGQVSTLQGTVTADDGSAVPFRFVRTILGPGPVVMGVATVAIRDDEFEDGRLTERSVDYYATDAGGNVWYFGEDVTNYRYDTGGALTGTTGGATWRAGVDGAKPGIALRPVPVPREVLFRAYAPKAREMEYSVADKAAPPDVTPAILDAQRVYTESIADAELRDLSWWARGIGLVAIQEDLSPDRTLPKVIATLVP